MTVHVGGNVTMSLFYKHNQPYNGLHVHTPPLNLKALHIRFMVTSKIDVNGNHAAPVYEWMKKEKPGLMGLKMIKWNFEKFLIGADGKVKQRWASTTKPEALREAIEAELAKIEKPVA